MTAETTAGLAPAVAVPGAVGRRWPAVLLGLGGLLTAVGGSLHPHDAQDLLLVTVGTAPSLWMAREVPFWRWPALGAGVGLLVAWVVMLLGLLGS